MNQQTPNPAETEAEQSHLIEMYNDAVRRRFAGLGLEVLNEREIDMDLRNRTRPDDMGTGGSLS